MNSNQNLQEQVHDPNQLQGQNNQPIQQQQPQEMQQQGGVQQVYRPYEEEKYCGVISWIICLFTGFCCIACCPCDKRPKTTK